jgi:16S rRNA (adenine1518-N6/adenine1519-N6)-dimethyltransferase
MFPYVNIPTTSCEAPSIRFSLRDASQKLVLILSGFTDTVSRPMHGSHAVKPKKSLGQYFLNNKHILEVGPGTGVLTRELLARGAIVYAIEIDSRAIDVLSVTFAHEIARGQLILLKQDVRTVPHFLEKIPQPYKVVANIPYYITGMLFRMFLESRRQPECIVFLTQKEVAERIAKDTKESLLSLSVKIYGTPTYVKTVKRGNFSPHPRVDSAIISITNISRERITGIDETIFFSILHAGFSAKRKQLLSNLSTLIDKHELTHILSQHNLPYTVRAEDIPVDTWISMVRAILSTHYTHSCTLDVSS